MAVRQLTIAVRQFRHGFTLIELLVVIAVISLLVSILLPGLNRAKGLTRRVICQTNLKGIMLATAMYANEENCYPKGYHGPKNTDGSPLAPGYYFPKALYPYAENWAIWVCPSAEDQRDPESLDYFWASMSYAINQSKFKDQSTNGVIEANRFEIFSPGSTVAFFDGNTWGGIYGDANCLDGSYDPQAIAPDPNSGRVWREHTRVDERHNNGGCFVFCDGHTEWLVHTTYANWSLAAD